MSPIKASRHPDDRPRGVRDGRDCKVQSGGTLAWIEDGQPMFWSNRPLKFGPAMRARVAGWRKRGRTVVIEDVKWKQLGGRAWWRLPDYPDGSVTT